jgi:hypothetical protein
LEVDSASNSLAEHDFSFNVSKDEFAAFPWSLARAETIMPEAGANGSVTLNARKIDDEANGCFHVDVHIIYNDDWRNYDTSRIIGGNNLEVIEPDHNVIYCSAYASDCTLSETIRVFMPRELFLSGGPIQVSGRGAYPVVIKFPETAAARVVESAGL